MSNFPGTGGYGITFLRGRLGVIYVPVQVSTVGSAQLTVIFWAREIISKLCEFWTIFMPPQTVGGGALCIRVVHPSVRLYIFCVTLYLCT